MPVGGKNKGRHENHEIGFQTALDGVCSSTTTHLEPELGSAV